MNVYALTPTGNRSEGLALLAEYLNEQTYCGELTWIIVDDCYPFSHVPKMRNGIRVEFIYPDWLWEPGMNTQAISLAAGLGHVPDDAAVLVLEDDDVYLPGHVLNLVQALENSDLVGEKVSRYYNVAENRYRVLPGTRHASLCSTGARGKALDAFKATCKAFSTRIDFLLWQRYTGTKRLLNSANVVGIKGLPGRPGIGVGHRKNFGSPDDGTVLKKWIGDLAYNYSIFREVA